MHSEAACFVSVEMPDYIYISIERTTSYFQEMYTTKEHIVFQYHLQ
jgi:hypothetical protein